MKRVKSRLSLGIGLLTLIIALSACSGIRARGTIGGQTLDTRVDSEVARYYLTNYLGGKRVDPVLDARIDQVYRKINGHAPVRDELKQLSQEFSVDFAALLLADELSRMPLNGRFRRAFDAAYDYTRKTFPGAQFHLPAAAPQYEIMIVPTYLYNRANFNGADLAGPRKALQKAGFASSFVETIDDGPIEANAEIVMSAIRKRAESGRRLIIISASKSGAEVALALSKMPTSESRHVAAWVNAVGALQGTPLIDDDALPDMEFFVGKVNPAGIESMSTTPSRKRFQSFHIPPHILVVNVFGIPVSGTISFRGRWGYYPMQKYGPSDGVLLLADMIYPGGITLTELGTDHFFLDGHLDITSVALGIAIIQWLETPTDEISAAP